MREILFRAKRRDSKQWVNGSLLFYPDVNRAFMSLGEFKGGSFIEVFKDTIGQYTGINVGADKLFEGDIVEWHEDYDDTWGYSQTAVGRSVVIWDAENFCWAFQTDDKYIQPFNDWSWNNSYIIGNIHDNPELLKGGVEE